MSADESTDIQNDIKSVAPTTRRVFSTLLAEQEVHLAREVFNLIGEPLDVWAVAAALESLGLRDIDAIKQYQRHDLFTLAERVLYLIHVDAERTRPEQGPPEPPKRENKLARALLFYFKGAWAALPMAGQIASVLLLRYSLWAWVDFTEAQATVVAIGTILSFIVTGGFIQSIGREGVRYAGHKNYFLAQQITLKIIAAATVVVLLAGTALYLLNLIIPYYDNRLVLISLMYFVLLSELWLFSSLAYVLDKQFAVFVFTMAGVIPVYLVMEYTRLGIYVAHAAGMSTAIVLTAAYTIFILRRRAKRTDTFLKSSRLPHPPVRVYTVAPYFVYGFLYFFNLFVDRIVSWSAPNPEPPPYIIWFRTSYELGMDWALLSLVLTMAALEYMIHEFSYHQIFQQRSVRNDDAGAYIMFYKKFFVRHLAAILSIGVLSIMVTYFGVLSLQRFDYIREVREFFSNVVTFQVFWAAAFGYFFLALGLYNCLFFFTLSRPEFAIRSIVAGLGVNVVVSLLLSRWIHYEYGVGGLVFGSLVFALMTMNYARQFFNKLDYYYYAAY
ncbi:MAG TPA: exopolysaccharide Pel transporter PelG [Bacteroidota bacterium]|nr:exopolysaccharide Pel transporter PelG [Bacteroidota bacterium]